MINTYFNQRRKQLFSEIMISAGVFALIAHGFMLFNKYSFHDDAIAFNNLGSTYGFGRWMLGLMNEYLPVVFGSRHISVPLLNGLFSVFFIALMIFLISDMIRIRSRLLIILLVGVFVSFPAVTSTFAFMFTAPYYFFGTFIGVLGAYIFYSKKTVITGLICSVLMACSTGIYQANISVSLCTLLLFMIHEIMESISDWKDLISLVWKNAALCVGFMAEYLIMNKMFLASKGAVLSDYKGVSNYGRTSIIGYLKRIYNAYREFFAPVPNLYRTMYHYSARNAHIILVLIVLILAVLLLKRLYFINKAKCFGTLSVIAVFPLAAYLIYVMVDISEIHSVMTFGEVFTLLLAVWILERVDEQNKPENLMKNVSVFLIAAIVFLNVRLSNICYLKAELLKSQTVSYYTTLITQIKSTEGYSDELPVVYIGDETKEDLSFKGTERYFDTLSVLPYSWNSIIDNYTWRETMRLWCGYDPKLGDKQLFESRKDVELMPCYPESGSIQIIDGTVIVKFSNQ